MCTVPLQQTPLYPARFHAERIQEQHFFGPLAACSMLAENVPFNIIILCCNSLNNRQTVKFFSLAAQCNITCISLPRLMHLCCCLRDEESSPVFFNPNHLSVGQTLLFFYSTCGIVKSFSCQLLILRIAAL